MTDSRRPTWADGPVLVLSPHLDDAIFSADALIASAPCEVWTVFAGEPKPPVSTGWDASCGFRDSDETMAARRAEDEAAFAGTGASIRHLPLLDGPYTDPERRRADLTGFAAELGAWVASHPGATVVAPAGAGARVKPALWERLRRRPTPAAPPQPASATPSPTPSASGGGNPLKALVRRLMHADYRRRRGQALRKGLAVNPDHVAVRDTVLDVARGRDVTVVLYEDLPYLWAEPADAEVADVAAARGLAAEPTALTVDVGAKFHRCRAYASQVDVMDPEHRRLSTPGHLPSTERYWILTRSDAS